MRISPDEAALASEKEILPQGTLSLLKADGVMRHGDFIWDSSDVPKSGKLLIYVDLRRQMVSVFRGGHEIGTAVIVYGAPDMDTPEGEFAVLSRHEDYHSRKYDAPMPYSLFFTDDGVALHASELSSRRATHGCVGLPTAFARHLFEETSVGDTVRVVRSEDLRI